MRGRATAIAVVAMLSAALFGPTTVGAATLLRAKLTGTQIANPRGGAPQGAARATLTVDSASGRICFQVRYRGLGGRATAGYLRHGHPGDTARPAVVLFSGAPASPVSGCVDDISSATLEALQRHPGAHYVDLASAKRPRGSVRGQLHKAGAAQLDAPASGGIG